MSNMHHGNSQYYQKIPDPVDRLAHAIVVRAFRDLHHEDPKIRLDALRFLSNSNKGILDLMELDTREVLLALHRGDDIGSFFKGQKRTVKNVKNGNARTNRSGVRKG